MQGFNLSFPLAPYLPHSSSPLGFSHSKDGEALGIGSFPANGKRDGPVGSLEASWQAGSVPQSSGAVALWGI